VPGDLDALRTIIDASDDELFSLDAAWCYTAFNQAHADAVLLRNGARIELGDRSLEPCDAWTVGTLGAVRERVLAGERVVVRMTPGDGGGRALEALFLPVPDQAGGVRDVAVRVRDVTEQQQTREALRRSEEKYTLIADFTFDWEAWRGTDGGFLYVSPSCLRITGHTAREFLDDPSLLERITHPGDRESVREHFAAARHAREEGALEFRVLRPDGETRWVGHVCTAVYAADGSWLGRRESNRDITGQKQAEAETAARTASLARLNEELIRETATLAEANAAVARVARTDDLTGIANRRHFFETAEHAVSFARRQHLRLALLSLDLDGFKRVNDTEGHAAGDEVLREFARLLDAVCRSEDLAARVGGDEFCLLLPGVDLAGAAGLAQRVLAAARSSMALRRHGVTASIGAAEWSQDEGADDLLRRGDDALYAAKRAGGDRLAVYDEAAAGIGHRLTWRTRSRREGSVT
jgi:diguanylate cyclase (GGDEF)-like protein/PAS domain S-box-containing protein